MVAMLAFGGTYAYFTATAGAQSKTATTGRVQLGGNSVSELVQKVVPGKELLNGGKVTVTPNSTVKTYVFVKFSVSIAKDSGEGVNTATLTEITGEAACDAEGEYKLVPSVEDAWQPVSGQSNVYYTVVEESAGTIAIDVCKAITFDGYSVSTETLKGSLMDATITVTIDSSSIQFEGFASDVAGAYAAATIDNV